jgi:hypothetical protein
LAIYIDIIARFNQKQLIKQGNELRDYINGLEDEIRASGVRTARGATRQIVRLDNAVTASRDQAVNASDAVLKARLRLDAAQKRSLALSRAEAVDAKAQKKLNEDRINAAREEADAEQDLVYKLQAGSKALNANELAKRTLNEETKAHAKNLRDVARITDKNRDKFMRLSAVTNRLRRDVQNLHATNLTVVQDNKSITKSMEGLANATKKTGKARERYNELLRTPGVRASQIKAQGRVVKDALEAESNKARDVSEALAEVIEQRREHDVVVTQNERSLRGLANQSLKLEQQSMDLRSVNRDVIDQSPALTRQFDRVGESVKKVAREYRKYHKMSQDGSVTSDALADQIDRINQAFVEQQRAVRGSSSALDQYYKQQQAAERKAEQAAKLKRARDFRGLQKQSIGQYAARNLGALTPLGTLSPSTLLPLAGVIGSFGEAVVTASQSLALLPVAAYAAAAGIGTLIVGFRGFGDALSNMGDPEKFAEALHLLSPNAQQAALSLKNLVDGPLGELKRATQDALFADVSPTLQALAQAFGPAIQRMTTSIATSFNRMFTGISFEMMTPEMAQRVGVITGNISAMFDRMSPGILAFNNAFVKLAETGSGFLPQMADGFTNLMVKFDNFINRAQEDGSLQNFIQKGIDGFAALSKWLLGFGQEIYEVFGNKSPEEFITTLNGVKDVLIGLGRLFVAVADVLNEWGPVIGDIVSALGGFENVLYAIIGAGFVIWLGKVYKVFRSLKGMIGPLAASFGLVGPAAKGAAATTASTFAAAGTTAGKGFNSKLSTVIKGFGWAGFGLAIGSAISAGVRDGLKYGNGDPVSLLPSTADFDLNRRSAAEVLLGPVVGPWLDRQLGTTPPPAPQPPSTDSFYKDWYPAGENPAMPVMPEVPDGTYDFPLPNVLLDEDGKALSETDILNKLRGELPRESYAVDPFTNPITGQKLTPMLPMGENGMPAYPTGGTPGTPSIMGPVMPQYNSFGQLTGYGANMVDPQEVFDAQLAVVDRAGDLEEANKDLLAAKQSGLLSAEEIHDLDRKVLDGRLSLHKALVQLGEAQTGDVEKLKTETDKAKDTLSDALGDFGAELDKDFGISKGLTGIAENLTKFLANLAFAPVFGAIRGAQAGLGFPLGEGTGSGLAGMAASSMGWYKGGPLDPGREEAAPSYPGYAPSGSPGYSPNWYSGGPLDAPVSSPSAASGASAAVPSNGATRNALRGINLKTIPVAAQKYANNCINAAAQIILSADGVSLTQDAIENTIARGGSITSLADGLNKINPSGGYVSLGASGGSPEALYKAVRESVNAGLGSVLNVAPGSSIAGRKFDYGHFIAVTGYDPSSGRINLSDTADGSMYSVTPAEAFQSSRGRGLVAGTGVPRGAQQQQQRRSPGPVLGPPVPRFAKGGEVPIIAHSGEHVLTRDDVAAMGGQSAVYGFRRSLHSYAVGGAIPRTPAPPVQPTDLGSLLGVGDSPPPAPPKPPAPPPPRAPRPPAAATMPGAPIPASAASVPSAAPGLPGPLAAEAPVIPVPPADVAQIPNTVLPPGSETPGTVIGAQVDAPEGYGEGFSITGGGLIGLAQGAALSGIQMAGIAGDMSGGFGGGTAGAAVAGAAMQMAFEQINRGIEYGAQVAAIGMQGLSETFLPAGGSELAQNNWGTRLLGGLAGAAPAIANLAGGANASNQSTLPGVGPPTPEQIAAQGMDPNRSQHTGAGAPAGPVNNIGVQIMEYRTQDNRPASQDFGRYAIPGQR